MLCEWDEGNMFGPTRPFGELDGLVGPTRQMGELDGLLGPTRPFGELDGLLGSTLPFCGLDDECFAVRNLLSEALSNLS